MIQHHSESDFLGIWIAFGVQLYVWSFIFLALHVISLALGALIQCFDWERVGKKMLDLTVGSGLFVMSKTRPLEAFVLHVLLWLTSFLNFISAAQLALPFSPKGNDFIAISLLRLFIFFLCGLDLHVGFVITFSLNCQK